MGAPRSLKLNLFQRKSDTCGAGQLRGSVPASRLGRTGRLAPSPSRPSRGRGTAYEVP